MYLKNTVLYLLLVLFLVPSCFITAQTVYPFTIQGKKYEFIKEKKNWSDASAYAVQKGGYLIEINSENEQKAVFDSIKSKVNVPLDYAIVMDGGGIAYYWIGASDKAEEGKWIWDGNNDGSGVNFWTGQGLAGNGDGHSENESYYNWGGKSTTVCMEPDNFQGKQNAAGMALEPWPKGTGSNGIAGEWNDIDMSNSLYFIVEYDVKTEIPNMIIPQNNAKNQERKPLFAWNRIDAELYQLQVSPKSDFSSNILIFKTSLSDTFFVSDVLLDNSTVYYWRISAIKGGKASEWSSAWSFTIKELVVDQPKLAFPENQSDSVESNTVFRWFKIDADSFRIQISRDKSFASDILVDKSNIKDTTYQLDVKLDFDENYYWRVMAFKKNKFSVWSDAFSFKLKLLPPESPKLIAPVNDAKDVSLNPTFEFSEILNADKYKLIISKNSNLSAPDYSLEFLYETGLKKYTLSKTLTSETVYYWSITSSNNNGESKLGSINKFTTKKTDINSVNNELNSEFLIFPNPVDDKISCNMKFEKAEIFSLDGIKILVTENNSMLDLKNLCNGKYYIIFTLNNRILNRSLTISR